MFAKFRTRCPFCSYYIGVGESIAKRDGKWGHAECPTHEVVTELVKNEMAVTSPVVVTLLTDYLDEQEPPVVEKPKREFKPSKYQSAVFEFVAHGKGHGLIDAKAGSGKTTTEEKAVAYTPKTASVIYLAFNKRIVTEAKDRMPAHCKVATTHSQAFANVRKALGRVQVEERKTWLLLDEYAEYQPWSERETIHENGAVINQLVALCKNTLIEPTEYALDLLAERYGLNMNGDAAVIYRVVARLLEQSKARTHLIDFDDMLWYCATGLVPCEQFDFVFIDEAQDLNAAQVEFVKRTVKPEGRIIAVGDPAQSIYGFRGADVNAIPNLIAALNATLLPLSICYRCPRSHIELARQVVPDIEPREDAPEGLIAHIGEEQMIGLLRDGDMVICRTNAPLIAPAFELIRKGIKAVIVGRDIGKNLVTLLEKVRRKSRVESLNETLTALSDYKYAEMGKLLAAHKDNQAASLQDQIETLIALADGCDDIAAVVAKIESVFSDDMRGIAFSSIHRAKGLEAERVFILHPELIPHPMAKQEWELKQESNLRYVAMTRSKSELYFVK